MEIKAIPIAGYLDSKGIKPNKEKGDALFYCASWRGGDNPTNGLCRNSVGVGVQVSYTKEEEFFVCDAS